MNILIIIGLLCKEPCPINVFKVFGNLLPDLGNSMDDHTARGLISNFIKPVVNDVECAKIIVCQQRFLLWYNGSLQGNVSRYSK